MVSFINFVGRPYTLLSGKRKAAHRSMIPVKVFPVEMFASCIQICRWRGDCKELTRTSITSYSVRSGCDQIEGDCSFLCRAAKYKMDKESSYTSYREALNASSNEQKDFFVSSIQKIERRRARSVDSLPQCLHSLV